MQYSDDVWIGITLGLNKLKFIKLLIFVLRGLPFKL